MAKQFLSLIISTSIFITAPAFAMESDKKERGGHSRKTVKGGGKRKVPQKQHLEKKDTLEELLKKKKNLTILLRQEHTINLGLFYKHFNDLCQIQEDGRELYLKEPSEGKHDDFIDSNMKIKRMEDVLEELEMEIFIKKNS